MSFTADGKHIIADVLNPSPCPSGYAPTDKCGFPEVAVIDVASGSVQLLTDNYAQAPALSPDGKQILYYHPKVGSESYVLSGLYEMDVDGSHQHQVISAKEVPVEPGAIFSPNGRDVLFTAYTNQDQYFQRAYVLPVSGTGTPQKYTDGRNTVYDADWTAVLTTCTVPNLKHKTLAAAKRLLKRAACSLGKVSGPKSHRGTSSSRALGRTSKSPRARR
jgi:hypothetical protein